MKIALAHHWYRKAYPSGENGVVEGICARAALWRELRLTEVFTRAEDYLTPWGGGLAAGRHCLDVLCPRHRAAIREGVDDATLIHLHNPWPGLGLGIFRAARDLGRPLVWTLHNYRLFATNGQLLERHDGGYRLTRPVTAEQLRHHVAMSGFRFGRMQNLVHQAALLRLWQSGLIEAVSTFICLNRVQQRLLGELGIAAHRIVLGVNACELPAVAPVIGQGAMFVGRLNAEKGIDFILRSWSSALPTLRCVGDGPLAPAVQGSQDRNVVALGSVPREEARRLIASARFLVMASTSYEVQPLVIIEALSQGVPCLVPSFGGMADMIEDGVTGRWYRPGDEDDFRIQARRLDEEAEGMRPACLARARQRYSQALEETTLLGIYRWACDRARP